MEMTQREEQDEIATFIIEARIERARKEQRELFKGEATD